MQVWRKLCIIVLLSSMVILTILTVHAQDEASCPLNEEDDCALWSDMQLAMHAVDTIALEQAELDLILDAGGSTPTTLAFEADGVLGKSVEIHFSDLNLDGQIYDEAILRQVDGMAYLSLPDEETWQATSLDQEGISFIDLIDLFSPSGILWMVQHYGNDPIAIWERGADVQSENNKTLAVYTIQFRLNELLISEQFTQGLTPFLTGFGGQQEIDSETANLFLSILIAQLSDQLRDAPFTIEITIDTETHLIENLAVNLEATLDFSFISDLMSGSGNSSTQIDPVILSVDYSAVVADYNVPLVVEVPEDWTRTNFNLDFDFFNLAGNPISNIDNTEAPTLRSAEFEITYGDTAEGTLSEENAHDYYLFTGNSGNIVTITAASVATDNLLDLYLKLYSADGELLVENDDALNNSDIGLIDAEIYRFSIPNDGDYLIEVTWLFAIPAHDYTLELTVLDE